MLVLAGSIGAVGCASLGYYGQAVRGHLDLTFKRRSIDRLIEDPDTEQSLRARLQRVEDIRRFAIRELKLPDSGSYTDYADLNRDVTVWLVTAAPEFSLAGKQWCYPFVGCLTYRGYFDRADAEAEAARLQEAGWETAIAPGLAYSTLGFMNDPVLNTMLVYDDRQLAGLIFHELAHERVFVNGDTRFNESFASAVEKIGRRRYAEARALGQDDPRESLARQESFTALLLGARQRLSDLYASPLEESAMRAGKERILAELSAAYARWKAEWDGYAGYDRWFASGPPNNAELGLVATYESAVPAFERLFAEAGGDFEAFYRSVESLAALEDDHRAARLDELMEAVAAP